MVLNFWLLFEYLGHYTFLIMTWKKVHFQCFHNQHFTLYSETLPSEDQSAQTSGLAEPKTLF